MRQGGEAINFGTYTKKEDQYIFISEKDGEKFTVNATSIGTDAIELKVKPSRGSGIELGGLKAGIGSSRNVEVANLVESNKCQQTEKAMKNISTALESYVVDYGEYPSGSFESMKAYLVPFYIQELPLVDAWGNSWRFEIFYTKGDQYQHSRLISFGSDGKPSSSVSDKAYPPAKSTQNPDIIIVDGQFISRCGQGK